jgi:acyl-CoA dehydrogenase
MANFQWERLLMALGAVGAMRHAVEEAVTGLPARPGGHGGAARHAVAELAVSAEAGAALTYHALRRFLDGARPREAAGDGVFGTGSAVREACRSAEPPHAKGPGPFMARYLSPPKGAWPL